MLKVFNRIPVIPGKSWLFPWFHDYQEILTIPVISQFPGDLDYSQEWKNREKSALLANTNYLIFFRIESLVFMNKENFLMIKHQICLD